MANQLQNKTVEQEIVVASGVIPRNTIVSNGSTGTNQLLQAKNKDDKPLDPGVAMVYTSGLSSNLSQLAELAASQAPSQTGQFIPTNPHQPNPSPGVAGVKYVVPGQNVPLPMGAQQAMLGSVSQNQNVPFPANIPPPFQKGSIIQLKSGELKRVEDLKTEDFVHSVNLCPEVKLETSTVISIRKNDEVGMSLIGFSINSTKVQVTLSCAVEHPFFVYDKGWSSCVPEKAMQKFSLQCSQLIVGDVCIFLSPNVIPPASRPQTSTTTLTSPEQVHQGTIVHQAHVQPENTGVPASTPAPKQPVAPSQVSSVAQSSSVAMTTASPLSAASAIPAGSTLIYDPQLGVLRPQSFINQQVIGTTIDGKTVPVQGGIPPFYQTIPASLVSSLPTQTIVQSPSVQAGQAAVGNGLLVTAVGIVPGQQGVRMAQPGMIYASQLTEMAQKQGHETSDGQVSNMSTEQQSDSQTDAGPPEAKRAKTEGQ